MKCFYTILIVTAFILLTSNAMAQVVLNEIYAEPGAGKQEFFELYNLNTTNTPASVDAYTVVSYFEEGGKNGFYVYDLPNLFVASKGYFVSSSAIPFNYQGNANSTASNISWNDPALSAQNAYLRKWIDNGNNADDGNKNYDMETLPVNFNDFFSKRSGGGASYNALVFKNGKFINSFFGGTGGNTNMPTFITSMPVFKLETVTASGTTTSTINFNSLRNKQIEYVTQDIGSDNGFIKSRDGFCGAWTKSSADAFHTPGVTNSASSTGTTGSLTIDAHLYNGATLAEASFVVYNITEGTTSSFPVELQIYLDNGSIAGQLDMNDEFVALNTETSLIDGPFTTFLPKDRNVILVAKTDAGCIDQILYLTNSRAELIVLPVKLLNFQGHTANNQNALEWTVDKNEEGNYFEVQKSTDGQSFTTAALVFNTTKPGTQKYQFTEGTSHPIQYYRLKIFNRNTDISFSGKLLLKSTTLLEHNSMRLLQNPIQSEIKLEYLSFLEGILKINVYSTSGAAMLQKTVSARKGLNTVSVDASKLTCGYYIVETSIDGIKSTAKLIKN